MSRTALLFSGQGSQYTGMGKDLCDNFKSARDTYELASEILGFDVLGVSETASSEELSKTSLSQPLIYTLSIAALSVLKENGVLADAVAGFSLGECAALTAAGIMDTETGLRVIKARADAMQKAAEQSGGSMYAVIGPSAEEIERICNNIDGYVLPVNFNCPGQTVIAGENDAAAKAAETFKNGGSRVVKLAVGAAFHSKLMESASNEFYEKIKDFKFKNPIIPFYSNVTGDKYNVNGENTPAYLKNQMTSPVRFIDEMNAMSRDGINTFLELGPGKTLCGFIRKGLTNAIFSSAEDKKTIEKCLLLLI